MATWVLIMTFWGDAIVTQEFNTESACQRAGQAMVEVKSSRIKFVCVPKG